MTPEYVIKTVSEYYGVPVEETVGTSRKIPFVMARHFSMYFIEMFCQGSLNELARPFGKDHDDMIFARHKINGYASVYKDFQDEIDRIRTRLVDDETVMRHDFYMKYGKEL